QIDEACEIMNDDGFRRAILVRNMRNLDGAGKPGEGMFLKKALPLDAIRAAEERQGPFHDVREKALSNSGIIFGEAELCEALILPKHASWVCQLNARKVQHAAFWCSGGGGFGFFGLFPRTGGSSIYCFFARHFQLNLLCRFILAQALEGRVP